MEFEIWHFKLGKQYTAFSTVLMVHASKSMESSSAEADWNCVGSLKRFQRGTILSTRIEVAHIIF